MPNKNLFTAIKRSTRNTGGSSFMPTADHKPLYNGNISSMAVNIGKFNQPLLYNYGYDQLNRIISMDAFKGLNQTDNNWTAINKINDYHEQISYDANGNVQTGLRNGSSNQLALENFNYNYDAADKNKLLSIHNSINSQTYNYDYNEIGETIKDDLAGNASLEWNVYGKLSRVVKTDSTKISFTYDASGNRISKTVSGRNGYTEWYVNDASGNIMAIYRNDKGSNILNLTQQNIYGSSRLAVFYRGIDADAALPSGTNANLIGKYYISFYKRGNKNYYFGNHLGNTLLITSDKKLQHSSDGTTVDYYNADVVSATDYSPFGVNLLDRNLNSQNILFGFNGKWNDFETGYENYGMRMYSTRDRRFKSVDPITAKYAMLTPYQFASNRPIDGIDLDGLEFFKKDNTNYRIEYKPVVNSSNVSNGIGNAVHNTISFVWNGTFGAILEGNKAINNYFAGGYKDPIPDIIPAFDNWQSGLYKYHTQTSIKQQLKDFGNAATDLQNYEIIPSLVIAHKLSMSKLSGVASSTEIVGARIDLATSFYKRSGFSPSKALSHMEGIDFEKSVQTITLRKGTVIQQWVGENGVGSYFTSLKNGAAKNLGISYEGRTLQQFSLTRDVKVLKSTAAEYKGNAGGGTQFFSTELKNRIRPKTEKP